MFLQCDGSSLGRQADSDSVLSRHPEHQLILLLQILQAMLTSRSADRHRLRPGLGPRCAVLDYIICMQRRSYIYANAFVRKKHLNCENIMKSGWIMHKPMELALT